MTKGKQTKKFLSFLAWLVGIFVALAVAFGMIGQTLTIPYIPAVATIWAGWIVAVTTAIGAVMKITEFF